VEEQAVQVLARQSLEKSGERWVKVGFTLKSCIALKPRLVEHQKRSLHKKLGYEQAVRVSGGMVGRWEVD
jgi:hypothetical protein